MRTCTKNVIDDNLVWGKTELTPNFRQAITSLPQLLVKLINPLQLNDEFVRQ